MMWTDPSDVEGECNARMSIADDYGDNSATIRCQRVVGHEGLHQEQYARRGGTVTITWTVDERRRCDHGCGQWEHAHLDPAMNCPKDSEDHDYARCALCHPGETPTTCERCGQRRFSSQRVHQFHCPNNGGTCPDCGQPDHGPRDCPKIFDGWRDGDSDAPSGGP